jgi:hypothetical protein
MDYVSVAWQWIFLALDNSAFQPTYHRVLRLAYFAYLVKYGRVLMRSSCLCVFVCPLNVARQRLYKHVPASTTTHETIEELFNVTFSVRPMSYQILNM